MSESSGGRRAERGCERRSWPEALRAVIRRGSVPDVAGRSLLNVSLRVLLLITIVWAFAGPVTPMDRVPLSVGAAALPPAAQQVAGTKQAAIFFPETGSP